MRRLSKSASPTNVSPDSQDPRSFVDAEQEYLQVLPNRLDKARFAKSEFDRLDKSKLRKVMFGEQASLCVYCERRISTAIGSAHIEHWRPRSKAPEFALHWHNLYLSCEREHTCGKAKGHQRLRWNDEDPDLPWPTELDYERLVGFNSDGRMYVRNDADIDEATRKALELAIDGSEDGANLRPAILNLNHPRLIERRRVALDSERISLERDFGHRIATKDEREERADGYLGQDQWPEFVSILVAWLRMTLGQGHADG